MLAELQRQFDALEETRRELIRRVRRLDSGRLNHKPDPGRWSILEDFQHLVLAEQETILEFGSIPASETPNPDNLALVLHVLDGDIAVDVPDPGMVPDGEADLEDLVRQWDASRERLHRFLDACGPGDLQTLVARHSVTGPLTVEASLRLLAAHFHHHRRRIEAAMAEQ